MNFVPHDSELNSYNRKSTVWVSYSLVEEKIREILKDQKEVFESDGQKYLDLSTNEVKLKFDFNEESVQSSSSSNDGIFRCLKSQFYDGVFDEESEFFKSVIKKVTSNGEVYKFFFVGKIKRGRGDVNLVINSNLLFDQIYELAIEKVLSCLSEEIKTLYEREKTNLLSLKVFTSIPLGAPSQLLNDDKKVESYLNEVFRKTRFSLKNEKVFNSTYFELLKKDDTQEGVEFTTEVKFKSSYELLPPILKALRNNNDKEVIFLFEDIGSFTKQKICLYINNELNIIRPLRIESCYGGGMKFNEIIINRYCDVMNDNLDDIKEDPEELFWGESANCYKNLVTLEEIKKQILVGNTLGDFYYFLGVNEKKYKADIETLKSIIISRYIRLMEEEGKLPLTLKDGFEKFIKNDGKFKVVLLGESFNYKSKSFSGVDCFLKGLGPILKPDSVIYLNDVDFIAKNLLKQDYSKGYTMYDNIGVVDVISGGKVVVLCDSKVGNEHEMEIKPVRFKNSDYVLIFTYVENVIKRIKPNFLNVYEGIIEKFICNSSKQGSGKLELNNNLKEINPWSCNKPESPFCMVPLFKLKFNDRGEDRNLILKFKFINAFEIYYNHSTMRVYFADLTSKLFGLPFNIKYKMYKLNTEQTCHPMPHSRNHRIQSLLSATLGL